MCVDYSQCILPVCYYPDIRSGGRVKINLFSKSFINGRLILIKSNLVVFFWNEVYTGLFKWIWNIFEMYKFYHVLYNTICKGTTYFQPPKLYTIAGFRFHNWLFLNFVINFFFLKKKRRSTNCLIIPWAPDKRSLSVWYNGKRDMNNFKKILALNFDQVRPNHNTNFKWWRPTINLAKYKSLPSLIPFTIGFSQFSFWIKTLKLSKIDICKFFVNYTW